MRTKVTRVILSVCLLVAGLPLTASASLTWLGITQTSSVGGVLDDVAYDDKHDVYLHVYESGRTVWARFIGGDGTPKGAAFQIPSNLRATFAGAPRVAYSAGSADDIFMVGFSSDFAAADRGKNVFGQMVKYTGTGTTGGTLVGVNFVVSDSSRNPAIFQTMNDIVFNPLQNQFLTVWDDSRGSTDVFARLFDVAGGVASGEINVSNGNWSQGAASVALDPEHNRYFVVYQGLHPASPVFPELTGTWAKLLDGKTGGVISGLIEVSVGGSPIEPNVVYLPDTDSFLAYWTGFQSNGRHVFGRQVAYNFEASGRFTTGVYPVMSSAGEGGADGSYNPATNTVLLAAMFLNGRVRGAELSGSGVITTPSFTMSTIVSRNGSYWPRVANGPSGQFAFVYGVDFTTAWLERYQGVVVVSTPGPSPIPPPSPTVPQPKPTMSVDSPGPNAHVAGSAFHVSGWAIDQGAASGTGVDAVDVWAYPVGSPTAIYVGAATYGIARPDVAGYVGAAQFTNSGFTLLGSIATPGAYDLSVFAHSTVSGTFNNVKSVRVTVAAASNPRMYFDTPTANQTTSQNLTIGGWALDLGSSTGTGVTAIHVWAYPTSGASPLFVGAATYGTSRPDVASYIGASRFAPSGFLMQGTLPPGDYNLVAFAYSSVTNSFNNAVQVAIKVR